MLLGLFLSLLLVGGAAFLFGDTSSQSSDAGRGIESRQHVRQSARPMRSPERRPAPSRKETSEDNAIQGLKLK